METKLKHAYIEEVKYQTQMLNHLKRWLKYAMLFSSISLVLIVLGPSVHPILKICGMIFMTISVLACLIIGLGIKNGQDNILKIIKYIDHNEKVIAR